MKNVTFISSALFLFVLLISSCNKETFPETVTIDKDVPSYTYPSETVTMTYQDELPRNMTPVNLPQSVHGQDGGSCIYKDCEEAIPEWANYYQDIADKTGNTQCFCIRCCLNYSSVYVKLAVRPRLDKVQHSLSGLSK